MSAFSQPTSTRVLNISYSQFNKSLIDESSFKNNNTNYTILDSYILKIEGNPVITNYSIIWWKNTTLNVSDYNFTTFVDIFKLQINSTYFINYSTIIKGVNKALSVSSISEDFQNFSLFVLAVEKPIAEVCGDSKDNDHDGVIDNGCSTTSPPSSGPSGSSDTSSHTSGWLSSLPSVESCSDRIKNQNELAIDCGGVCTGYWYSNDCHSIPQPTCTDGIKNQGEIGVDCGGPCQSCPSIEQPKKIQSCVDSLKNQDETNIDCGGVCSGYFYENSCHSLPQDSCFDNLKNQDEENIDCGGICQKSCESPSAFFGFQNFIMFGLGGILLIALISGLVVALRKSSQNINHNPSAVLNEGMSLDELAQKPADELLKIEVKEDNLDSDSDFNTLVNYINKEQARGIQNSTIKEILISARWPDQLIEGALERSETVTRLKSLDEYIKKSKLAGHTNETIRKSLIDADWAEHFIDMVLHEVHIIHDDFTKIQNYAETMFKKGYSKEDILKTLVDVGWEKADIEPYILDDAQ